jgi:uncharacterized NAD(P)/FAD-binding protein YdhS
MPPPAIRTQRCSASQVAWRDAVRERAARNVRARVQQAGNLDRHDREGLCSLLLQLLQDGYEARKVVTWERAA